MNGIAAFFVTAGHKKVVINSFDKSLNCIFRSFYSSQICHSYVRDIRMQMDTKRRDSINDVPYKNGRFLVMDTAKGRVLISRKLQDVSGRKPLLWTQYNDLISLGVNVEEDAVFLRVIDGDLRFAANVASLSEEQQSSLETKTNAKFISLRASLFNLDDSIEVPLVSQSHSLLEWKHKYKFCVYCGGTLENELFGMQKKCCQCKVIHYPTVNPVGITLICNENYSKVLLVRQPVHPPRMFTCIAGFIESGESVEENVKREVAEEVGLEVSDIQYAGSQHWSISGSRLMIACFATVKEENFSIDPVELEEAYWFNPKQIRDALNRVIEKKEKVLTNPQDIWIPPSGAIAHSLIKFWLQKYH